MLNTKDDKELKIWFEEIHNLDKKINELDKQMFRFDIEQENEEDKIQNIEYQIENLREEKNRKDWQLNFLNIITVGFFNFFRNKNINSKIKNLKKKIIDLKINISEIEKNKQPLKNLKLTVLEKINISWKKIFINLNNQQHKNISQKFNQILLNQKEIITTIKESKEYKNNKLYLIDKNPFENNILQDEGIYINSNNNSSTEELCFDKEKEKFDYPKKLNPFGDEDYDSDIEIISENNTKSPSLQI